MTKTQQEFIDYLKILEAENAMAMKKTMAVNNQPLQKRIIGGRW